MQGIGIGCRTNGGVRRTKERVSRLTVGERIKMLRSDRGYSREKLAEMSYISEKLLMKLSSVLEVSLDYIMTGTGSRKYEDEIVATLEKFKPDTLKKVDRLIKTAYEISKDGE